MSEQANELPDGIRRDGDGVAYHAASGLQILPAVVRDIDGSVARHAFAVVDRDGNNVQRPRYFPTEGEAIARVEQLVAFAEIAEQVSAVGKPATPEPWTPKNGERVRVAMADGSEAVGVVDDSRPAHGTVVGVQFPGEDKRRLIARSWLRPHADPAPDPRDAEIERLRVQAGEQSREIYGLKDEAENTARNLRYEVERRDREIERLRAELAVKPAAAPLSAEELERIARDVRAAVFPAESTTWDQMPRTGRERWCNGVDVVVAALLPDPARAAEAEAALKREQWIEATGACVERLYSGWAAWLRDETGLSQTVRGHATFAAAIDAAMEKHPLKREGE